MRVFAYTTLAASLVLTACASTPAPVAGMMPGKFVNFECTGGRFSARLADDGNTVRVRGHHGAAELERKADGAFEGEGYRLVTSGPTGVSLSHGGKPAGTNCKLA